MASESAPPSAADKQRGTWIIAALLGGVVLAYAALGFVVYEIVVAIF
jgi:hypothetical protein